MKLIDKNIKWIKDERLGDLTFSCWNLAKITGMDVEVFGRRLKKECSRIGFVRELDYKSRILGTIVIALLQINIKPKECLLSLGIKEDKVEKVMKIWKEKKDESISGS